ncbi:unnamed protein product [Rotaria socialis]|uniref:Beta-lactamase-related domain-containing protein n=2 Tax=Rotaria socialis TaxID=392032 RepID=A0A817T5B2_9BILA|nr:unnamed protein product [Rotaria socialis]CAF4426652.1 unnamed protein product [Rotaria socialis]
MLFLLWVFLAFIFNSVTINGSDCPNRQWIEKSLEKVHVPGATILVVNATHILYEQAFGFQSLLPLKPIDIDKSIFPIASISKTFIATAVMQLVEQELVDLDTDINEYLLEPQKRIFHPRYPLHSITLRKLLSHSASIHIDSLILNTYYKSDDDAFKESLADMCFKYINPNTPHWLPKPPGTVASYSNEGSALAALVVERVSNMSYSVYVKEKILKPLGIDISKVGVRLSDFKDTVDLVKHYAYAPNESYLKRWNQQIPQLNIEQMPGNLSNWLYIPHFSFSAYPAGLLRMSARTLSIYLRMFLSNGSSILRPRSIAQMRTVVGGGLIPTYNPNSANDSSDQEHPSEFGLSWYWQTMQDGRRYIGHSGLMPGMLHLMLINEKHNLGVIILSNADATSPNDLSREIGETGINIHMSLFKCFDAGPAHGLA